MISIIDDDSFAREATGDLLESLGYPVSTFSSAEHFLQSGRLKETACLITDVQMPGLTGLDLQQILRADGNDTPIIFMTGADEEPSRKRAIEDGAVGFLNKPFDEQSLIRCLASALHDL
jgi:FixJ family two-component response regulator